MFSYIYNLLNIEALIEYEIKTEAEWIYEIESNKLALRIDKHILETECIICLSEYKQECFVSYFKCGHFYHTDCINKWLQQKRNCPCCRLPFYFKNHKVLKSSSFPS